VGRGIRAKAPHEPQEASGFPSPRGGQVRWPCSSTPACAAAVRPVARGPSVGYRARKDASEVPEDPGGQPACLREVTATSPPFSCFA
jgi:hypothetical protein